MPKKIDRSPKKYKWGAKRRAEHAFLIRKMRREDPVYRANEVKRSYAYFQKRRNDLEYRENHNAAQQRYEERQEILGENAIIAHNGYRDYAPGAPKLKIGEEND